MPITAATTPMHSAPAHSLSVPRSRRNRPGLSASAALSRGGGTGRNTNFQFRSGRNGTTPSLLSGLGLTHNTFVCSEQVPHVTNMTRDTRQGSSFPVRSPGVDNRDFLSSTQKSSIPFKTTSSLTSVTHQIRHTRSNYNHARPSGDRFIPNRAHVRVDLCRANLNSAEEPVPEDATARLRSEYNRQMKGALLNIPHGELSNEGPSRSTRMLPFKQGNQTLSQTKHHARYRMDPYTLDQLRILETSGHRMSTGSFNSAAGSMLRKAGRTIRKTPIQVRDAPGMVDDFYANILSWGDNNFLAVGLGDGVALWNARTGDSVMLLTLQDPDDYVTSVSWMSMACYSGIIAIGTKKGSIQLWDAYERKLLRTFEGHDSHVGSLAWNQDLLSAGGGDSTILQHDIRAPTSVATYTGHTQAICGLKWNGEGTTLASGGNDNVVCLWNAAMSRRSSRNSPRSMESISAPQYMMTDHNAAVKALAWCPLKRGLLATGGGEGDGTIKFWNSNTGSLQNSISTGSQVCSLLWSKHRKEICSSHGGSENQLSLWEYPTMSKIQDFKGHQSRVLNMDQSPESGCVMSTSADETLHLWDIFGSSAVKATDILGMNEFMMGMPGIR